MDDFTIESQFAEVLWDCGSPSPNAWKSCQVNTSTNYVDKIESIQIPREHEAIKLKKARNIFKIDSKALDKAKTIIAQLRTNNNDNEGSSSLDLIFEQSGDQEELASSFSSLPTTNEILPDISEQIPADFWNDDVFNEARSTKLNDLNGIISSPGQVHLKRKTSTPLRPNRHATTTCNRDKLVNYPQQKIPSDVVSEKRSVETATDKDLVMGILPASPLIKQLTAEPTTDALLATADTCVDYLLTFNTPRRIGRSLSRKRPNGKTPTRPLATPNGDGSNNKLVRNGLVQTPSHVLCNNKNPSKGLAKGNAFDIKLSTKLSEESVQKLTAKEDNISISDEILSQLIMDDSWTLISTAKVPEKVTVVTDTVKKKKQLDQSVLNCIDSSYFAQNTAFLGNGIESQNTSDSAACIKSSPELPATVPVDESLIFLNQSPTSCHPIPNNNQKHQVIITNAKSSPSVGSFLNGKQYTLKAHSTPSSPATSGFPASQSRKCSAAEIERKRQRALQRKRLRTRK